MGVLYTLFNGQTSLSCFFLGGGSSGALSLHPDNPCFLAGGIPSNVEHKMFLVSQ